MIFAELLKLNGQDSDAEIVNFSADKLKNSFYPLFWNEKRNCLFDVVNENGQQDESLRPNQLFAISLPFPLLDGEKAAAVLNAVSAYLYTPVGLKTLPADDPAYIAVYGGDVWHRDSAYHQGTVWSWLLGPYIDATVKVYGSTDLARQVIERFSYHLSEGCIGSVSEIFDAESPHQPRGCIAQAWGVAEILRVIKEYSLFELQGSK